MRLARFDINGNHQLFAHRERGWVPLPNIRGGHASTRMTDFLAESCLDESRRMEITELLDSAPADGLLDSAPADGLRDLALDSAATVVDGGDIWGAGLNYLGHSTDLNAEQPKSGPGSYLRPSSCLIDNGQQIVLPTQSKRVTAEAELGLVVGKRCKNVRRDAWRSVIAGVTAVLDMTAEDVIRENPRYIPWAKGFDTFCSVGPQLVTLDEFDDAALQSIRVSTIRNGEVIATAQVSAMKYDLSYLVEYFSAGRTLAAGTVICTGTPGAAVIGPGDSIKAVVDGVGTLSHTVA